MTGVDMGVALPETYLQTLEEDVLSPGMARMLSSFVMSSADIYRCYKARIMPQSSGARFMRARKETSALISGDLRV
jgi:hypothetical protein